MKTRVLTLAGLLLLLAALTWGALKAIQLTSVAAREEVPATRVRKGA